MHRSPSEDGFAQKRSGEEEPEDPFAGEFSEPKSKSTTCVCCKSEAPEYGLNCGLRKDESELSASDAMILRSRRESTENATFLLLESEPWNKATDEVREIAEKQLGRGSPATNGVQIAPVSMSQELGPHCTRFSYGRLWPTISQSEKATRSRILCVSLISELHDRKLPPTI